MLKQSEKIGSIFIFLQAILWGMFPIIVSNGAKQIPPFTYATLSTFTASFAALIYLFAQQKQSELKKKEAYTSLLLLTLFIVVIPYSLYFLGAKTTTALNASFLLLSEMLFTLIFTHFIGEKTTILKLLGSLGVMMGAGFILYNGKLEWNLGDVLIILSTATYPLGNFYAKKAIHLVSSATILFTRFLLGGFFLLALSLVFEKQNLIAVYREHYKIILLNGILLLTISKVLWYEGLRRLDISKAISLSISFPFFTLLALLIFYKQSISFYQWIGICIMMVGVYFSLKRKSTSVFS